VQVQIYYWCSGTDGRCWTCRRFDSWCLWRGAGRYTVYTLPSRRLCTMHMSCLVGYCWWVIQ